MLQNEGVENEKPRCDILSEKKFVTSPADVDTHRKVKLQDVEVLDKYKIEFEKLCEEYGDVFSKDSSDIGKTPLITMEIETGDSPPICQRPYIFAFETYRLGTKRTKYAGKSWCNH